MTETLIHDVMDTAYWVATCRAMESERADALFQDPLADKLAGEHGRAIFHSIKLSPFVRWNLVIRTVIIDAYVQEAIAKGCDTILNLGAGLDTRPYRMNLPRTLRWIEADFPKMVAFKTERLRNETPVCALERHGLDLSVGNERRRFFAEVAARSKQVLVITEGVIPYLSENNVGALADDLRAVPAFRWWITEYFTPAIIAKIMKSRLKQRMRNAPFLFNPQDWQAFFSSHGWAVHQMKYLGEEGKRFGRSLPLPLLGRILTRLAPPEKRRKMDQMMGYALLEAR